MKTEGSRLPPGPIDLLTAGAPWAACAVVMVAFAVVAARLLHIPPAYDELLTYLAAAGIRDTGSPTILDGAYSRALLYSQTLAVWMSLAGESLEAARALSLIFLAASAVLTFEGARRYTSPATACLALALFLIFRNAVSMGTFVRFYTAQTFLLTLVIVLLSTLLFGSRSARNVLLRAVLILAAAYGALALQISTLIPLAVLAVLILFHLPWRRGLARVSASTRDKPSLRWLLRAVPAVAAAALLLLLWHGDVPGLITPWMPGAAGWQSANASNVLFYAVDLKSSLGYLLGAFVAVCTAAAFGSAPGRFFTLTALGCLAVHSLLPPKDARYIVYILPTFAIAAGIGFHNLCTWLTAAARKETGRFAPLPKTVLTLLFCTLLLFSLNGRRLLSEASGAPLEQDLKWRPDWQPVAALLGNDVRSQFDAILVSAGVKGVWYLGDYDFELNRSVVSETSTGQEFGRDRRTGRRVIGSVESVERILREHENVLVVSDTFLWDTEWGVPERAVQLIETHLVDVSPAEDVKVFVTATALVPPGAGGEP